MERVNNESLEQLDTFELNNETPAISVYEEVERFKQLLENEADLETVDSGELENIQLQQEMNLLVKARRALRLGTLSLLGLLSNQGMASTDFENKPKTSYESMEIRLDNPQKMAYESLDNFIKYINSEYIQARNKVIGLARQSEIIQGLRPGTLDVWLAAEIERIDQVREEILADPETYYQKNQKLALEGFEKFEEQRDWLVSNMESPVYQKRFEQNHGRPNDEYRHSIDKLKQADYRLNLDYYEGGIMDQKGVEGLVAPDGSITLSSESNWQEDGIGVHEFQHYLDRNGGNIPDKVKEIYQEAFGSQVTEELTEDVYYMDRLTELHSFKKQLDYLMDVYGIKSYNDPFKRSHWKDLVEIINRDHQVVQENLAERRPYRVNTTPFSDFVINLLLSIKNEEAFINLMNTIAINDQLKPEPIEPHLSPKENNLT